MNPHLILCVKGMHSKARGPLIEPIGKNLHQSWKKVTVCICLHALPNWSQLRGNRKVLLSVVCADLWGMALREDSSPHLVWWPYKCVLRRNQGRALIVCVSKIKQGESAHLRKTTCGTTNIKTGCRCGVNASQNSFVCSISTHALERQSLLY